MSYGQDVEETKEWDRFWGSGRVEDYLRFKGCSQEEESREYCGEENGKPQRKYDRFI